MCRALKLQIANGFLEPGAATFLDGLDAIPTSVIDYMLFLEPMYNNGRIERFEVLPPLLQLDHTPIRAVVQCEVFMEKVSKQKQSRLKYAQMPAERNPNAADLLLKHLTQTCVSSKKSIRISPTILLPESRNSSNLRRQMTILSTSPMFRSDTVMIQAYKALAKERMRVLKAARIEASRRKRDELLSCQGNCEYWDFIRAVRGRKAEVLVDSLAAEAHFRQLLNVQDLGALPLLPQGFDEFSYNEQDAVPELDDPIDPDEVKRALKKMKNSANGEDCISVAELRHLKPDDIALFFHKLSVTPDDSLPSSWLRSILVPIPKPGGDKSNPKSLRGLSVQTAIRRLYSRCLVPRFAAWMEQSGLVPPTQSGFRKGYCTTDNLIIIRTLHERLLTSKKTFYLAFIDLKKAFDNVDRPSLWRLLHCCGAFGSLLRTLRKLYCNTSTSLRIAGRYSAPFMVDKGVLQGDPLSPILFIMYIGELALQHPDDPILAQLSIPQALLADDIALPSTTHQGLQLKLDTMTAFFSGLGMRVNVNKSKIMRLGYVRSGPNYSHSFTVNGLFLEEVKQFKYVGYLIEGGKSMRWRTSAYVDKCIHKARTVATSLLQLRRYIGPSNADFIMRFYQNLVDPYFVFASEVSIDVSKSQEQQMDQVLLQYMRSSMGLPSRSIRILPLLDNAVFDVRCRRIELAARFVEYAWRCDEDGPVHRALLDSMDLHDSTAYKHAWFGLFASRVAALGVDPTPRRGLAMDVKRSIVKLMKSEWEILRGSSRIEIH